MIFTARAEYGVRLLVALGHQADGAPLSLRHIAEAEALPFAYLEAIAAKLRRAGLIEARRGAQGGYRLARAPEDITMEEAIVALEGVVAPMACFGADAAEQDRVLCSHPAGRSERCATRYLWTRVQGGVLRALQDTTLADLVSFSARTHAEPPAPLTALPLAKELHA